jgi:HPt (histidine-containing phosphotransfer) domain-containing protein
MTETDLLPYYDIKQGLGRLGNNKMLYKMLLPKLVPVLEEHFQKFLEAYNSGNYEEAERIVHTDKGTSGNLSVNEVHFKLSDLDVLLKQLKTPDSPQPTPAEVDEKINAVINAIKKTVELYTSALDVLK